MASKYVDLQKHVVKIITEHGSLNKASANLGIDKGYLSRLAHGGRTNPSAEVLDKLGLRSVTFYMKNPEPQEVNPCTSND